MVNMDFDEGSYQIQNIIYDTDTLHCMIVLFDINMTLQLLHFFGALQNHVPG